MLDNVNCPDLPMDGEENVIQDSQSSMKTNAIELHRPYQRTMTSGESEGELRLRLLCAGRNGVVPL